MFGRLKSVSQYATTCPLLPSVCQSLHRIVHFSPALELAQAATIYPLHMTATPRPRGKSPPHEDYARRIHTALAKLPGAEKFRCWAGARQKLTRKPRRRADKRTSTLETHRVEESSGIAAPAVVAPSPSAIPADDLRQRAVQPARATTGCPVPAAGDSAARTGGLLAGSEPAETAVASIPSVDAVGEAINSIDTSHIDRRSVEHHASSRQDTIRGMPHMASVPSAQQSAQRSARYQWAPALGGAKLDKETLASQPDVGGASWGDRMSDLSGVRISSYSSLRGALSESVTYTSITHIPNQFKA
ncbi:hypothetical protein OH77DRAFT_1290786 [Trametes cingulata]|nr:hypothetical protein OH77DRAFT_1290786 [Trametes cingulata]